MRRFLLIFGVLIAGCDDHSTRTPDSAEEGRISFSGDVQPILDAHCLQCHAKEMPQADLVLEDGQAIAMLVGAKSGQAPMLRVAPGDPGASYLVHKLKGTHLDVGGAGMGMPLTEGRYTALDARSITTVEQWIRDGARKD